MMNLRHSFRVAVVMVFASCTPTRSGTEVYSKEDGKLVGVVIGEAQHSFGNGLSGPAVHFRKSDGSDVWSSRDAFNGSYEIRPKK